MSKIGADARFARIISEGQDFMTILDVHVEGYGTDCNLVARIHVPSQ